MGDQYVVPNFADAPPPVQQQFPPPQELKHVFPPPAPGPPMLKSPNQTDLRSVNEKELESMNVNAPTISGKATQSAKSKKRMNKTSKTASNRGNDNRDLDMEKNPTNAANQPTTKRDICIIGTLIVAVAILCGTVFGVLGAMTGFKFGEFKHH